MYVRLKRVAAVAVALVGLGSCTGGSPPPSPVLAGEPGIGNAARPFDVWITPETPQPMLVNEPAAFRIASQRDGYAQIYILRASGSVLIVAQNLALASGPSRLLPAPGDGFSLIARPPAGTDTVILLVTREPFTAGLEPPETRLGPMPSPLGRADFLDRLRRALGRLGTAHWNSATAEVRVLDRT